MQDCGKPPFKGGGGLKTGPSAMKLASIDAKFLSSSNAKEPIVDDPRRASETPAAFVVIRAEACTFETPSSLYPASNVIVKSSEFSNSANEYASTSRNNDSWARNPMPILLSGPYLKSNVPSNELLKTSESFKATLNTPCGA